MVVRSAEMLVVLAVGYREEQTERSLLLASEIDSRGPSESQISRR